MSKSCRFTSALAFASILMLPTCAMAEENYTPIDGGAAQASSATDSSSDQTTSEALMTPVDSGAVAETATASDTDANANADAQNTEAAADESAQAQDRSDSTDDSADTNEDAPFAYDGTAAENVYADDENTDEEAEEEEEYFDDSSSFTIVKEDKAWYQAELGVGVVLLAAGVAGFSTSLYYSIKDATDAPTTVDEEAKYWLPRLFVLPSFAVAVAGGIMTGVGATKLAKWNDRYGNQMEASVSTTLNSATFTLTF